MKPIIAGVVTWAFFMVVGIWLEAEEIIYPGLIALFLAAMGLLLYAFWMLWAWALFT